MDELRFRSQQSPRTAEHQHTMNSLVSPPRNSNRHSQSFINTHDLRSNLPRRFTTDSGRVPTLSSLTSLPSPRGPPEPQEFVNNAVCTFHCVPGISLVASVSLAQIDANGMTCRRFIKLSWYALIPFVGAAAAGRFLFGPIPRGYGISLQMILVIGAVGQGGGARF